MRIIAKGLYADIPYERAILMVDDFDTKPCIMAVVDGTRCALGVYQTEAEAVSELDKIRTAYQQNKKIYYMR